MIPSSNIINLNINGKRAESPEEENKKIELVDYQKSKRPTLSYWVYITPW